MKKSLVVAAFALALCFVATPLPAADAPANVVPSADHWSTDIISLGLDLGYLPGLKLGYKHAFENHFTLGADLDLNSIGIENFMTVSLTAGYRIPLSKPPYAITPYATIGGGIYYNTISGAFATVAQGTWGVVQPGVGIDFSVHRIVSLALEGGPDLIIDSHGYIATEFFARLVVNFNVWQQ